MQTYLISKKAAATVTIAGLLFSGVPVLAETVPGTTPPAVSLSGNAHNSTSTTGAGTEGSTTVGAGAAAAGSGAMVPAWAWFLLALILLAALLYWAYRRSVAYDAR